MTNEEPQQQQFYQSHSNAHKGFEMPDLTTLKRNRTDVVRK